MAFTDGVATVELKGGESATATGLPTDATYEITEASATGFQLTGMTGDTGTITTTLSEAEFTNTRETGDLTLSKKLISDLEADKDQEFTFTLTLYRDANRTEMATEITGTYGGMTFTNGVATVTLKGGQSLTAEGLPTTLTFTVTEAEDDAFELTGKIGDEGTISTTAGIVVFTNTRKTVDISVTKVWEDNDDEYGLRPESLTVKLYKQFGEGEKTLVDTQTLTADTTPAWSYTWTGLPQYGLNGAVTTLITYTVEEGEVPAGYTGEVSGDMTAGYTITNTFKPVDTDPPVAKVVKGDTPDKAETFTFKLVAVETDVEGMTPATMPLPEGAENGVMTMTIEGAGMKEFGQFFFTKPGYYKYEIYEVNDCKKGYTYDTHVYTVEYNITVSKKDNSLMKEMKVDLVVVKEFAADQFKFINTYEKELPPPPYTGDDSRIAVNAVMMGLSMAGIVFITKKKKEEDAETE